MPGKLNVLLPDLRGHGESGHGEAPWSLEGLARDMVAIAETEQAKRLILVGESFGALVVAQMACLIPDRVELLICSEPPLSPARLVFVRQTLLSARLKHPAAQALAEILEYGDPEKPCEVPDGDFHSLLGRIDRPLILLHGTGGTGALASVIDADDCARLLAVTAIKRLAIKGGDHLVLRSIGSSLLRALFAEQGN